MRWLWYAVWLCGALWGSVVRCEALWYAVRLCGTLWGSVVRCEALWYAVRLCGTLWGSVVRCEALWYAVRLCGTLWGSVVRCEALWYAVRLCGTLHTKITKKSVIWFWLLNMTIWCKHVHRLELQNFFNFSAAHSPVRLDIETKFLYFLFLTWLSIVRNQESRLQIQSNWWMRSRKIKTLLQF